MRKANEKKTATCSRCGEEARAKGLCTTHYQLQRRRGQGMAERKLFGGLMPTFRIEPETVEQVLELAKREDIELSEWLRRAVRERVERANG